MTNEHKNDAADKAIAKLNEMLDSDQITIFTADEADALKEVAKAWRSAQGFVYIASLAGATLKWCVAIGLAWAAFKTGLFGFFTANTNP